MLNLRNVVVREQSESEKRAIDNNVAGVSYNCFIIDQIIKEKRSTIFLKFNHFKGYFIISLQGIFHNITSREVNFEILVYVVELDLNFQMLLS